MRNRRLELRPRRHDQGNLFDQRREHPTWAKLPKEIRQGVAELVAQLLREVRTLENTARPGIDDE